MSDETVLTKEIAEQFLEDEDSVDLSEFTAIEDKAAEVLSKLQGVFELALEGLTGLSEVAAESLSKFQGELYLGPISSSETAFKSLSKRKNLTLGVTDISDTTAELLSDLEWLGLHHVCSLSDDAAEKFGQGTGVLDLRGLENLSDAAANSLAARQGLTKLHLESLPKSAANILRDSPHIREW